MNARTIHWLLTLALTACASSPERAITEDGPSTETPSSSHELIVSGEKNLGEDRLRAALSTLDYDRVEFLGNGQFLVNFRSEMGPKALETLLWDRGVSAQVSVNQKYSIPNPIRPSRTKRKPLLIPR